MTPNIKRFLIQASAAIGLSLNALKKTDYRTLSHYILKINAADNLASIVDEASNCLSEILNYGLFSFAIEHNNQLDVWIDPSIYHQPVTKIIGNDFSRGKPLNINLMGNKAPQGDSEMALNPEELSTYDLAGDDYVAKLYLIPQRMVFGYHLDIIKMITETLEVAIGKLLSIKHLEGEIAIDPLTKAYSRRELERLIDHHISSAQRHAKNLSVIMLDIDYFKKVNDKYGHLAGDQVLTSIAKTLKMHIRKEDYLFRFGGEEFLLLLPDTPLLKAIGLAERLRIIVEGQTISVSDKLNIQVTASFGVSTLKREWNKRQLLKTADDSLYLSKENGRNQVTPALGLHAVKNTAA